MASPMAELGRQEWRAGAVAAHRDDGAWWHNSPGAAIELNGFDGVGR
jgi:hypothetical protein